MSGKENIPKKTVCKIIEYFDIDFIKYSIKVFQKRFKQKSEIKIEFYFEP